MDLKQEATVQEEKIFEALKSIGIDEEQAKAHLERLADTLYYRIGLELEKHKQSKSVDSSVENLSEEENKEILEGVISSVYGGYFKAITRGLNPEKLNEFEAALGIKVE